MTEKEPQTFTPEQLEAIKGIVAESTKSISTEIAKTIGTKITEAVAPVTQRLEQVEGKVSDRGAPKGGGDDKDGETKLDGVIASLNTLSEKVTNLTTEREAETKQAKARRLVDQVVAAKYPGLAKKSAVLDRLYGRQPESEEQVEEFIQAEKKYAADLGLKEESFGVDPGAEGGKSGEGSDEETDEQKAKKKAEDIRKRRTAMAG